MELDLFQSEISGWQQNLYQQRILRQRKLKINQFNEKLIMIETLKLTCQLLGEGWLEL